MPIRLTRVRIQNFRCIRDLTLELDDMTVLIGENNSGKTAVLSAIELGLSPPRRAAGRVFDEYDYRLADERASVEDADPIRIHFHFEESGGSPWPRNVTETLNRVGIVTLRPDARQQIVLRVSSSYSDASKPGQATYEFLDHGGGVLGGGPAQARQLGALRSVIPVASLAALRSVSREFSSRGEYWRDFLSVRALSEEARKEFEDGSAALNQALVDAHAPLGAVRAQLARVGDVIDFGQQASVSVDALPSRAFAALSRSEVSVSAHRGAKIPLWRQGEGTQSLAVLLLFDAHLRSRLEQARGLPRPLTLIEEPEAHLHPGAVRTLKAQVDRLPGQKILSTHSGDFLSTVPPTTIRRLVSRRGEIRAGRIQSCSLVGREGRLFHSHVQHSHGRLLFSRCWLIVEGETEVILFEGVADALGTPLESEGIHCVETAQKGPERFATVANQLGIRWFAVFDGDDKGRQYARAVSRVHAGGLADAPVEQLDGNTEVFLCENGFGSVYEKAMSLQKRIPTRSPNRRQYWRQVIKARGRTSKPDLVTAVVEEMRKDPDRVPSALAEIVQQAIARARAA